MNRNDTLNEVVFIAAKEGQLTEEYLHELTEVALGIGLDPDEVSATISSAVQAADRIWGDPLGWVIAVVEVQRSHRVHRRLVDAAMVLAATVATCRGDRDDRSITMSCRELAERLGVSRQTASNLLEGLRRHGLMSRRRVVFAADGRRGETFGYSLAVPQPLRNFLDIHPLVLTTSGCMSRVFHIARMTRDLEIRRHILFQSIGGGHPFTTIDAALLAELDGHGAGERKALTATVQTGGKTMSASLARLTSAGLAEQVHDHVVPLWSGDLLDALDQIADRLGVPDRQQLRKDRHQQERANWHHLRDAKAKAFAKLDADSGPPARIPSLVSDRGKAGEGRSAVLEWAEGLSA